MSEKNKIRVYAALYYRQGITCRPELAPELGLAMYHWAIWTEESGVNGPGCVYQVQCLPQVNTATGPIPEHWEYDKREADISKSRGFLGRLMIGKLPVGTSFEDVDAVLKPPGHPLPLDPSENCVDWTKSAIAVLQQQGWADEFDIGEFMQTAYSTAKSWYGTGDVTYWQFKRFRSNYIKSRKFP